jgi:hypothetical protein
LTSTQAWQVTSLPGSGDSGGVGLQFAVALGRVTVWLWLTLSFPSPFVSNPTEQVTLLPGMGSAGSSPGLGGTKLHSALAS